MVQVTTLASAVVGSSSSFCKQIQEIYKSVAINPVWNLYDEYRTARLNVRYYERKLSSLRRNNLSVEFILAISISSGVVGLWVWQTTVGGIFWKALVTLAAFLSVLKPIVRFSDQIQQNCEILANWRSLDDGFQNLTTFVKERKIYDEEMQRSFHILMDSKSKIIQKEPKEAINQKLRRECFNQVNTELPANNFFVPEKQQNDDKR
jgi:hypothetical protein